MLRVGLKSGQLPDFRYLNLIAKTSEQISAVNICSKISGLSDANGASTLNTIFHTQLRNRLTLVSVYVSISSLSSPTYPNIKTVVDEDDTSLLADYTSIDSSLEEFDYIFNNITYKITFLKRTYKVASGGMNKNSKYEIYPMDSSIKDFTNTYLNSMFIMQIDGDSTGITLAKDETLSSYQYINKIKEAFRLNMSYNLISINTLNNKVESLAFDKLIYMNDLYEVLSIHGEKPFIGIGDDINSVSDNFYYDSVTTINTLLDSTIFTQNTTNKTKLEFNALYRSGLIKIQKGLSLTTTDTENKAIDSLSEDALNSYDLIMINRDFANRLQGKLYYPIIGNSLDSNGNPGSPIDLNITMNNNIDNLDFNKELTLINGYKLKFAIF